MTISFMAGRRIQGLDSDRTATQLPAGAVGGWVELGRTTLGSAGDTITVSSLADKRYYMVLAHKINSGASQITPRLGNGSTDTGSNYAVRWSRDGAADTAQTSQTSMGGTQSGDFPDFSVWYIANYSTKEKLLMLQQVLQNTAGATEAPKRTEHVGKWVNTSNPLDVIHSVNFDSGDYAANTELVVLGWDPADTHTTNFWQELADVSWSSGDTIDTGTFTAKKYLWVQSYTLNTNTHFNKVYFNNDSGANYAFRWSENGGADGTFTSTSDGLWALISQGGGSIYTQTFSNYFIINNASNEKLVTGHCTYFDSTRTGAGNAPWRHEVAGKWANTSNQITSIKYVNAVGNNFEGGRIKVWGAD